MAGPPNKGRKPAPRGPDGCLEGCTFVVSGVLDSLERDEAEDFIKRHGGKVTSAVSGKTTYLLVGMDCGKSKYAKAKSVGTPLMDEDGLFAMVEALAEEAAKNPVKTEVEMKPADGVEAKPEIVPAAAAKKPAPSAAAGGGGP